MASLAGTAPATSNGHAPARPAVTSPARAPKVAGRNRAKVAGGAVVMGMSALVAIALMGESRQEVLALSRSVEVGQVLSAEDFTVVRLPSESALKPVGADRLPALVGQVSRVPLTAGALLAAGQVGRAPVASGSMVVGAVLKPGQFPLDLRAGDQVRLVVLPDPAAVTDGHDITAPVAASVTAVERVRDAGGATAVSLALEPEIAPLVAAAGADGRLSVMREVP